jgi:hypothetical protein
LSSTRPVDLTRVAGAGVGVVAALVALISADDRTTRIAVIVVLAILAGQLVLALASTVGPR